MRRKQLAAVIVLFAIALGALLWWRLHDSRTPAHAALANDPWAATAGTEAEILARKRSAHGDAPVDQSPATVSGHVTHQADGTGVGGAVVTLEPDEFGGSIMTDFVASDRTVVAVADAHGAWTTALPPGRYIVTAGAPDLLPASRDVAVTAGARRDGLDLALAAGGATVHGTVSDIFGGPIASARITVHPDGMAAMKSRSGGVTAVTGADGGYQLTLADGEWEAKAAHVDYSGVKKDFELTGHPLTLDFKLAPAGTIRGQVVSRADGKPVPGAMVSAGSRKGQHGESATTIADARGNFTLRGVRWGTTELSATARGFASAAPTAVELGVGEQVDNVKVFVERAFTISGFVVHRGAGAAGIPGVRLGVFSLGSKEAAIAPAPSGEDGYFEIVGVRPASYMTFAIGGDVMPDVGKPIVVKDKDITNVLVVMDTGAALSGRVDPAAVATLSLELDQDKVGFGNLFDVVKAEMVTATSDPTGAFALHNVPEGEYTIVARVKDGRVGRLKVTTTSADQTGLVIKIEPRAAISGRVVDAGGAPVMGVRVKAVKQGEGVQMPMTDNSGTLTAGDGTFRVGGLDPGKVTVSVSDDQGPLAWADKAHDAQHPYEVDLTGAEETRGLTLTVEPRDGVISGSVVDVDGQPAADAWVTATLAPPQTASTDHGVTITIGDSGGDMTEDSDDSHGFMESAPPVVTGPDGKFTVDHLRRGTYSLVADGAKGTTRARKPGVATGSTVLLKLETLGSLSGAVTAGTVPVTDYVITCTGPTDAGSRHVIAADGAYAFERLAPGAYHCIATADIGPAAGDATLANAPVHLDLAIGAWGSIAGTVVDALTAAPLPALKVAVMGNDTSSLEALITGGGPTTDASGKFEIGKQAPGKSSLMVFDGGLTGIHPIAHRDFTLTAGQHLDLGLIKGVPPRTGAKGTLGLVITALKVDAVVAGGPAAKAGVKPGDVIAAVDGHTVDELGADIAGELIDADHVMAGAVTKLRLTRGAAAIELSITADPAP